MQRSVFLITGLTAGLVSGVHLLAQAKSAVPLNPYTSPDIRVGQVFSNVFSRTNSYRVEGYDDIVRRNSGTAAYVATEVHPGSLLFDTKGLYDGSPEFQGTTEIKDNGRTLCWAGKCGLYTDGSGLVYNSYLWGSAPHALRSGLVWNVTIPEPWELGPPGTQTVTVVSIDAAQHSVTLKREGTGIGFFDSEAKQLTIKKGDQKFVADVTPGKAHWIGLTTFQHGIVVSDELIVERALTLSSKETGTIPATHREYILLNATPAMN